MNRVMHSAPITYIYVVLTRVVVTHLIMCHFYQAEEEFLDGDEVIGLGALGKEGSGRLRVNVSNKQRLSAKAQKKFKLKAYGSGGGTSGLSSSLAFTPIQV